MVTATKHYGESEKMIKDIYIGIDGGGTRCKARVEDAEGSLLGEGEGGPANIRLSVNQSWQSILQAVRQALQPAGITLVNKQYRFHLGCGLAGTEVPAAVSAFLGAPHPFATLKLKSDAYTACLGAHNGEDGAIIIIGTGVVGLRIQGEKNVQVGGWGFPHGDEGGGAWLGLEAVRLTLQAADGRISFSPLLKEILNRFDGDLPRFVSWANASCSTQFAEIAPMVVNAAQKEDPFAVTLIKKAAGEIGRIAETLGQNFSQTAFPISLFGGVSSYIKPWLNKTLRDRITQPKADAIFGALCLVRCPRLSE